MENAVLIIGVLLLFAVGYAAIELLFPTPKKRKRAGNKKRRR